MRVLVVNCNSWVGYHIVDALLMEEFLVDGVVDNDEPGSLEMFFGRNSLFEEVTLQTTKSYDIGIITDDFITELELPKGVKRWITISTNRDKRIQSRSVTMTCIYPSLLIGEWMNMNKQGIYRYDEFIRFDSDYFKEQAIYITDFVNALLKWIQLEKLPASFQVFPKQENISNKKVEKMVFLRKNRSIDTIIQLLKKHYEQFQQ
ncbi:hypothetical protein [Oceanobacillus iheyensis HTE831]|uniref:Uncharacterized protein n=1 Tax=Oceanobacillus iheyensis (strain DSM 14371 / CIP 107618 / JCM 11309 / KCTC 3954 / HTE831) TaxID=221109 RepID=Q8ERU8_OCEIH|nr:hypothetical protein [Oceanobacillus iheyensis]BAC13158.1 hypothetical protein [Oceanobacillus iheyensis HTE831]